MDGSLENFVVAPLSELHSGHHIDEVGVAAGSGGGEVVAGEEV